MLMKHQRRSFWSWYLLNLLGWVLGISGGFNLATFYLFPLAISYPYSSIVYKLGDVIQLLLPSLALIVCLGIAQWLKFRQWKVKINIYKWVVANIKGTFVAVVIFILLSAFVGAVQQPLLNFLYYHHLNIDQTDLIVGLISGVLPLLGSIGTSAMVAIDIFEWKIGRSDLVA